MLNSRLVYLLKTLKQHKRELHEFEKFVISPFHNSKKEVRELFFHLKQFWKYLNTEKGEAYLNSKGVLERRYVFHRIFPNEKDFNQLKVNKCISDLSKLMEDFFVLQELKNHQHQKQLLLLDALKKRGVDNYYFNRVKKFKKELSNKINTPKAHNPELYHYFMRLNEHIYFHPNHLKSNIQENNKLLADIMEGLEANFIIKKLKLACELESRKKVYGLDYSSRFIEDVIKVATKAFSNNKTIQCYLSILQLFKNQDVSQFSDIEDQLKNVIKTSDVSFKLDLFSKLINAIPPHPNRLKIYFNLYKYALKTSVLIEYRFIAADHFNNVLTLASFLDEKKWAMDFLSTYSSYLKLENDNLINVKTLFYAHLLFNEKQYQEALILLRQLRLKDISYGLRYYQLIIMTIIEGGESIDFNIDLYMIHRNFNRYLNRYVKEKKLSTKVAEECKQFIKITQTIYQWEYKRSNKEELIRELEFNHRLPQQRWLLGKVRNLK